MHLSAREAIGTKQAIGLLVCLLAAVVNVVIATHTPMTLLADAFGDDATFIRAANTLLSGNYLGDYNSATLTKGPGYSIFLALGHLTGLAASLTIALFFLTALAAFSYMVARTYGAFLAGALVFVLGALHPVLPMERFVRDSIYPAQVLLMLAACAVTLRNTPGQPPRNASRRGTAACWLLVFSLLVLALSCVASAMLEFGRAIAAGASAGHVLPIATAVVKAAATFAGFLLLIPCSIADLWIGRS